MVVMVTVSGRIAAVVLLLHLSLQKPRRDEAYRLCHRWRLLLSTIAQGLACT